MFLKIILISVCFVIVNFALPADAKSLQSPETFLIKQTARAIAISKSAPPRAGKGLSLKASPTKTAWLSTIYDKNIVSTSGYSTFLSDKLKSFKKTKSNVSSSPYV